MQPMRASTAGAAQEQEQQCAEAVSRIFGELRREMDTIIECARLDLELKEAAGMTTGAPYGSSQQAGAAGEACTVEGEQQLSSPPLLRLSHARTESETPGYYDQELQPPLGVLPEAVWDLELQGGGLDAASEDLANKAVATVQGSLAEATMDSKDSSSISAPQHTQLRPMSAQQLEQELQDGISRAEKLLSAPASRQQQQQLPQRSGDGSGSSGSSREASDYDDGARSRGSDADAGMAYMSPRSAARGSNTSSGSMSVSNCLKQAPLSYRELLDRALAWNPRVKAAANSGGCAAASGRQRANSTGRIRTSNAGVTSPPDFRARLQSMQQQAPGLLQQQSMGRSKFPSAAPQQQQQHAGGQPWCPAGSKASRETSFNAFQARPPAAGLAGLPGARRTGGGGGQLERSPNTVPKIQYRSRSAPREQAAARRHIERMNASPARAAAAARESILSLNMAKQQSPPQQQQQHNSRGASARSPDVLMHQPMRLPEDDWSRFKTPSSPRQRQQQQQPQRQWAAGGSGQSPSRQRGGGRSSSTSPGPTESLDPEFFRRQNALLQKRAALAAAKRPSDEGDMSECTFHPHINPASRSLRRSVEQLHAWDARRKLMVFAKALDKCDHECDGYTFTPTINPLSRQLALANYAVAPDPARPWTTTSPTRAHHQPTLSSPRHGSPSPEAVRMLRDTLPPANIIQMAGPTAQQKVEDVMDLLRSTGQQRRSLSPSRWHAYSAAGAAAEAWLDGGNGASPSINKQEQLKLQEEEAEEKGVGQQEAGGATVLGVPAAAQEAVALGVPATTEEVTAASTAPPARGVPVSSSGSSTEAAAGDGSVFVQLSTGEVALTVKMVEQEQAVDAEAAAAPAASNDVLTLAQPTAEDKLLPQLLLAALKVIPKQVQQDGKGASAGGANGSGSSGGGSSAPRAVRGSSSGGLAPATPLFNSSGGTGMSNGGSAGAFAKQGGEARIRDDSAGGMYSASHAKKVSAGGVTAAGAGHNKHAGASPLSRSMQQRQVQDRSAAADDSSCQHNNNNNQFNLQELAEQLGFLDKGGMQAPHHAPGLHTVPACYYYGATPADPTSSVLQQHAAAAAAAGAAAAAPDMKRRPSSYSERYKNKVGSGLRASNADAATGSQLPPDMMQLMDSLSPAGAAGPAAASPGSYAAIARRSSSSGGGAGGSAGGRRSSSSPPHSPSFQEVKAKWMAKEAELLRSTGGGSTASAASAASTAGGAAAHGHSEAGHGLFSVGSCTLTAPGTPLHAHDAAHPFAGGLQLHKQYSGGSLSHIDAATAAAITAGADGALRLDADSVLQCVTGQDGHMLLILTNSALAAASQQQQASPTLPTCSSILSVPDAAAAGATLAASESCNGGCPLALVTEKVEVLLEGTQSVPFELVLSPRSKHLIAAGGVGGGAGGAAASLYGPGTSQTVIDINSPLGQQVLQLILAGRAQAQQTQQALPAREEDDSQEEAEISAPAVPAGDSVGQLLSCRDCSNNSVTTGSRISTCSSSAGPAALSFSVNLAAPDTAAADTSSGGPGACAEPDIGGRNQQQQPEGAVAGAAAAVSVSEGNDLAAELAALLQSAGSMSPEEKADAVARTFAKTISRLNMSTDVLQQTIAVLDPTQAAPATASPAAGQQEQQQLGLGGDDIPTEPDSIQQLLERVSKGGGSPGMARLMSPQASVGPPQALRLTQQQQQQQDGGASVRPLAPLVPVNSSASRGAPVDVGSSPFGQQQGQQQLSGFDDSLSPSTAAPAAAAGSAPTSGPSSPSDKSWATIVAASKTTL